MEENTEQQSVTETEQNETGSAAETQTETPKDGEETGEQEAAPEEGTEQPNEQTEIPSEEQQPTTEPVEPIAPIDPGPEVETQLYTLKSGNLVVKYEMTLGDILTCTLLATLILILLVNFFHRLILGGNPK